MGSNRKRLDAKDALFMLIGLVLGAGAAVVARTGAASIGGASVCGAAAGFYYRYALLKENSVPIEHASELVLLILGVLMSS